MERSEFRTLLITVYRHRRKKQMNDNKAQNFPLDCD